MKIKTLNTTHKSGAHQVSTKHKICYINFMKTKLLTICLLLFTSQVFAINYNWTYIPTSGDNDWYVDYTNIMKNKSGNKIVWTLVNSSLGSDIATSEFDCKRLRMREIYVESYEYKNGKGKLLHSVNFESLVKIGPGNWMHTKPGTIPQALISVICK